MSQHQLLVLAAAGVIASACASSPDTTADQSTVTGPSGWTGTFQAMQERTGVLAPTRRQQASGTVRLRQSARDPLRSTVSLVVSTSVQDPGALRWALLPGRCGAPTLPLIGHDQFPQLEMSSSGRGQIEIDIPVELPQSGSYHVNVYSGGTGLDDVVTCANLRRGS